MLILIVLYIHPITMINFNKKKISDGYEEKCGYFDGTYFFRTGDTYYWLDKNGKPYFDYNLSYEVFMLLVNVLSNFY